MTYDVAICAIEEGLRLSSGALMVVFHGGEPTLAFDLIRRAVIAGEEIARKTGKRIYFAGVTNLGNFTQPMIEFSREHRVFWTISLDGTRELNDQVRIRADGSGTYELYRRALERNRGFVTSCGMLTVVTSINQEHLLEIARHMRQLGMHVWDWTLFQAIGQGRALSDSLGLSTAKVIRSWNELFDAVVCGEFDGFVVQPVVDYLRNFLSGPASNMCLSPRCGAARDLLCVSADGGISGCDCIDETNPMQNLGAVDTSRADSLIRALSSELGTRIRNRTPDDERCRNCLWVAICGATCLAFCNSLNGIHLPLCQIASNAFIRIAQSIAESDCFRRYWRSITPPTNHAEANDTARG